MTYTMVETSENEKLPPITGYYQTFTRYSKVVKYLLLGNKRITQCFIFISFY